MKQQQQHFKEKSFSAAIYHIHFDLKVISALK